MRASNSFETIDHEVKERNGTIAAGHGDKKSHWYFLEMFERQMSREEGKNGSGEKR